MPEDAARVTGRITHQTFQFPRQLAGFVLYPFQGEMLAGQARNLFPKGFQIIVLRNELLYHGLQDDKRARQQ